MSESENVFFKDEICNTVQGIISPACPSPHIRVS